MRPVSGSDCRHALRRALEALLALAVLWGAPVMAASAIQGSIRDRVTDVALGGVTVELRQGGDVVGSAISKADDGSFLVTFDVGTGPQAVNLKLVATHPAYQGQDRDVVVTSGRPRPDRVALELMPGPLADCMTRQRPRWVVVGHFRPPLSLAGAGDFSARVSDAVRWELAKIAETSTLPAEARPAVVPCDAIDIAFSLAAAARELHADVLLAGNVLRPAGQSLFTVKMFVGDQHGLFKDRSDPLQSRDVDLEDPSATRLEVSAASAIVEAVLTGYRNDGRFAECVELSRRAGVELRPLSPGIKRLSDECASQLPTNGLRGGAR